MLNLLAINGDVIQPNYDVLDFQLILFLTNLTDKYSIHHEAHQIVGYLTKSLANVCLEVNVLMH